MRYIDEFRDTRAATALAELISTESDPERDYHLMEFCGGHTHAVFRHGLPDLLPDNIELIHGPGCPVCVLPVSRLDQAIELASNAQVTLVSYGDMLRVPGSRKQSLALARTRGADIRVMQSPMEAIELARENPQREVVLFAIGFETTTPPTALAILEADRLNLENFSVLSNHVLTPSAIQCILDAPEIRELGQVRVDGFIGPSHVSTIIGSRPYEYFAREYQRPVVIAGFEPNDILASILMLIRQINRKEARVENQFTRGVTRDGNRKAQAVVARVFELRPEFEWRGLGKVVYSGLRLKSDYSRFDAEIRFPVPERPVKENRACQCPSIIRGVKKPLECPIFGTACTPRTPIGSCMVSPEGACAAWYKYRYRPAARG